MLARSQRELDAIATEIDASGGHAVAYAVDLSDADAATSTAQRVLSDLGVPDILINNAGAGRWLYTEETPAQEAISMMALPYFAAFFLTRAFLPGMLARRGGRIVNVESPAAFTPWPGATGYTAARWALRGFTQALRADLRGSGVGVTQVIAGQCASNYWTANPGAAERLPGIGRLFPTLTPVQVADAIVRGIERDRANVIVPFALRAVLALHKVCPWPVEQLVVATGHRRTQP